MGFTNQSAAEDFLAAKDIIPQVDFSYLNALNKRLRDMVDRINAVIVNEIKIDNVTLFKKKRIDIAFAIMNESGILTKLNNQGRRPEQVYFNWMRGYVTQYLFLKALGLIFEVTLEDINLIGEDKLKTTDTFKRSPTADLELPLSNGEKVRIEIQSGFTGTNDIKQHKVLEAKRVFQEQNTHSVAIHFDFYNGQVAFVKLNEVKDGDVNWITRSQMEGQMVFTIDQNYFIWKLTESPPKFKEIDFS